MHITATQAHAEQRSSSVNARVWLAQAPSPDPITYMDPPQRMLAWQSLGCAPESVPVQPVRRYVDAA